MPPRIQATPRLSNTLLISLTKVNPDSIEAELSKIDPEQYTQSIKNASIQEIENATKQALRMFENPINNEAPKTLEAIQDWIKKATTALTEEKTPPSAEVPALSNHQFLRLIKVPIDEVYRVLSTINLEEYFKPLRKASIQIIEESKRKSLEVIQNNQYAKPENKKVILEWLNRIFDEYIASKKLKAAE